MTVFYLMSGEDIGVTRKRADKLGVQVLDKSDLAAIGQLGQQYHDKVGYVVDDDMDFGETVRMLLESGALKTGTENPRFVYLNPQDALQRFPSENPDFVITDFNMKAKYGINGDDLIRRMREIERGF